MGIERRRQFLSRDVAPRARDIHRHRQASSIRQIICDRAAAYGDRMNGGINENPGPATQRSVRASRRTRASHRKPPALAPPATPTITPTIGAE